MNNFDGHGAHPLPQSSPQHDNPEAQEAVADFAAQLKWGLLNRLLFWGKDNSAEPVCDICQKPITREQFAHSAATLDHRTRRWRVTHNDCESDDSINTSCFQYWIALNRLGTPQGALKMTTHLLGHIGFPHWKNDVIDRLYPVKKTTALSAQAS
jgi:hypothetical protein